MCSETSPRISFSNDIGEEDDSKVDHGSRRDTTLLDSNSDFEFSICRSLDHEPSLADDLFAGGMILPVQMQERTATAAAAAAPKQLLSQQELSRRVSLPPLPSPSACEDSKKESMKQIIAINSELEEKPPSKSFWGFKRSSSLNCDIKKSLICSLPLLSRSNSTGSVPNPKKSTLKDIHKQHGPQKLPQQSNSTRSASSTYVYSLPQKPPLRKNSYGGSHYINGVRISPVLNVPPPYISKGTAHLFGLGSLLRNGKEKKNNKK